MLYLSSNIQSSTFYGTEFLQTGRYTLGLTDFVSKASQLYTRIVTQGGNKISIIREIKKVFQRYTESFVHVL